MKRIKDCLLLQYFSVFFCILGSISVNDAVSFCFLYEFDIFFHEVYSEMVRCYMSIGFFPRNCFLVQDNWVVESMNREYKVPIWTRINLHIHQRWVKRKLKCIVWSWLVPLHELYMVALIFHGAKYIFELHLFLSAYLDFEEMLLWMGILSG